MPVIRLKNHGPERPYVKLSTDTIRLGSLSLKAIGLWTLCMSLPDNWTFYVSELLKRFPDGRTSLQGALAELVQAGLAAQVRRRDERGHFSGSSYDFYEHPSLNLHHCAAAREEGERTPTEAGKPTAGSSARRVKGTPENRHYQRRTSTQDLLPRRIKHR